MFAGCSTTFAQHVPITISPISSFNTGCGIVMMETSAPPKAALDVYLQDAHAGLTCRNTVRVGMVAPDGTPSLSPHLTPQQIRAALLLMMQQIATDNQDATGKDGDIPDGLWLAPEDPDSVTWNDGIEKPPARFDHVPGVPVREVFTDLAKVDATCGGSAGEKPGPRITACTTPQGIGSGCLIVLPFPDQVGMIYMAHLRRHERAHCNGWRHPGR
jgi:hypothetical protein